MEGMSMRTILGVLVSALLIAGCAGTTGSAAPSASAPVPSTPASVSPSASASASAATVASPSPSGAFGGVVHFTGDGATTTTVDGVADGPSVTGTAVTDSSEGTHTVKVGCAAQNGDFWAVAGKTDKTTVHGEKPGDWSAVIVKNGSPQMIVDLALRRPLERARLRCLAREDRFRRHRAREFHPRGVRDAGRPGHSRILSAS